MNLLKKLKGNKSNSDGFWPCDDDFEMLYNKAMEVCGLEVRNFPRKRRRKFLVLEYLNWLLNVSNDGPFNIAEVGVYKGVLSFMMSETLMKFDYDNISMDLFDSFEGLSERTDEDKVNDITSTVGVMKGGIEEVSQNLKDFDFIKYYKGWIPECFKYEEIENKKYNFVSIDVDLYQPIIDSLDYFYPKLTSPGVIVIDDYKTAKWPGVEKAVAEFSAKNSVFALKSTLGLATIVKI